MGAFPPPYGGVQVHMVELREYLLRSGHECLGINLTRHRRPEAEGIFYPRTALGVLWLLSFRLRYDVIHLHIGGELPLRLVALCFACSCIPGKRVFLTFHSGGYSATEQGKASKPASIQGFVLRRLDGLIAVNEDIASVFLRYGVSPNRVHVISPWAVPSADASSPIPANLQQFMKSHSPLLTTVGLLEPEYDLGFQIDAFARVLERWPQAGLLIVGSGHLEGQLRQQIQSKPYAAHVRLCGDLPRAITLQVIQASSAFLRTTRYDGDALSVREALHLGVPTIATENGMRPHGVILIPVSNAEALLAAIDKALSRPRASAIEDHPSDNLGMVTSLYSQQCTQETNGLNSHTCVPVTRAKLEE